VAAHHYLDYNGTCPQLPEVSVVMQDVVTTAFGNPSSLHWAGRNARRKLDDARDEIARYLHADASGLVFTSGGTESNNMVIQGVMAMFDGGEIVVSAIEHPAVLDAAEEWAKRLGSWKVVKVKPDADGKMDAATFMAACNERTKLACLMWANNETGVIQPVHEVAKACRALDIPLLVDGVQALGKIPIDLAELDADFVSFSGHKIGAPRGVGLLAMRKGVKLESLLVGGGQERGRRSGTEFVAGICGFAAALGVLDYAKAAPIRDDFEAKLKAAMTDVHIFGASHPRTGNTSMFCIPGLEGETLLMQMDLAGFAVASGSACSSGKRDPSHVLMAMGAPEHQARSSLRVSLGAGTPADITDALVKTLLTIRQRLRKMSGR